MKKIVTIFMSAWAAVLFSAEAYSQNDVADIYNDRADTLSAAAVSGGTSGSLSRFKDIRTEVITAAGLCKMACCNLAESFENSASVTVGYSDAVTGARQIRLLGLSGTYTQMLDENRPVMRGLASPFGLSYIPGQWLSSIQIAKGAPSVINGVESITGQINMEHRKPTDEIPLFVNASVMSDVKADLNIASSLQLDKEGKWSTAILGHVSGNFIGHDMNRDGILDEPRQFQINLANRWLYYGSDGTQVRFGFRFLRDSRNGGEYNPSDRFRKAAYNHDAYVAGASEFWGSSITNQNFNAYLKVGIPLNADNSQNIAFVGDFNDYSTHGGFGASSFDGTQISAFGNLLYQNQVLEKHHFTVGLTAIFDKFDEIVDRHSNWKTSDGASVTKLLNTGVFGEYTFHAGEKFTAIAGTRLDWYKGDGFKVSPRVTLKYSPFEELILRFNGGRGLRYACPISDNIGVLSTSKPFLSNHSAPDGSRIPIFARHPLEDAWVFGGNATVYMPFGANPSNTYLSFDYFRTQFSNQLVTDYDCLPDKIDFYTVGPGKSFTDTYQLDFNIEPLERFTVTATFRYTNAKVELYGRGLQDRPMTSRFKGVLNMQYATNLNKWIFDFTASVNGPCKVYDFMAAADPEYYKNGNSPVYPLLYFQITHRMKGWDLYIGGENLTNFTQKKVLQGTDFSAPGRAVTKNPSAQNFDASCVWGPLMGIRGYIGVRITLWKKG